MHSCLLLMYTNGLVDHAWTTSRLVIGIFLQMNQSDMALLGLCILSADLEARYSWQMWLISSCLVLRWCFYAFRLLSTHCLNCTVLKFWQNDEETRLLRTLFNLFSAFHSEACLLTTIPTNAWIDSLCRMISELIKTSASDVSLQTVNGKPFLVDFKLIFSQQCFSAVINLVCLCFHELVF